MLSPRPTPKALAFSFIYSAVCGVCAGVQLLASAPAAAVPQTAVPQLSTEHRQWLEEVEALISPREREAFESLPREYQRQAFIERFWEVRDPFPQTGRNEFLEAWKERVELARERFKNLDGDRAQTVLLAGAPAEILTGLCPRQLRPIEVWRYYDLGGISGNAYLVFLARGAGSGDDYRHWPPIQGIQSLMNWSVSFEPSEDALRRQLAERYSRGAETVDVLSRAVDWEDLLSEVELVPRPTDEWAAAFLDRSTEVPTGADDLPASLELEFPGRHQNRTVVQGIIAVPREEVTVAADGKEPAYRFLVDGEVLLDKRLFERFRYRFDLPAQEVAGSHIPLAIQRYLRPNRYTLILKIEDLVSHRFFRTEQQLQVPAVAALQARHSANPAAAAPSPVDQGESLLTEANAVLSAADHTVKILAPSDRLHTDRLRVEATVTGDDIAKVAFILNGKRVMTKTRPPYSVEVNLGHAPRLHLLEAVASDATGRELARDLPRGESLDRVEIYLNETLLATLFQPPFAQPVLLPQNERITYVRAVAYLDDGNSTEDLVFINTPQNFDQVQVNFVELYTSVSDRRGALVEGLSAEQFVVLEDGVKQSIRRFERVKDLPIHAGILLDSSTSMIEEMAAAVEAALRFFDGVVEPKDRAAVVVFNDTPLLKVPFTNNLEVLAGGLADVVAEGETALYDSLVFTLHYFSGIRGKRSIILLTDGRDSRSRHSFEEALEFARRSGVALYTIGLGLPHKEMEARMRLQRFAKETGGRYFFITSVGELERIYQSIEEELRSQYLLAYQSSHDGTGAFRRVEVRLKQPGLEAKTIPGYYP
jgi:VWFA-related protein